jgi:8-oxo-dGTP pyrophosphatase MutT (NUDIX family)
MEYFDVYDRYGNKVNQTIKRGTRMCAGQYYRVVHLWIKNNQNAYLIQQRNKATDTIPYQWAPTAGAVQAGETPLEAVIREAKEELGLRLIAEDCHFVKTWVKENHMGNVILDVFYVNKNIDLKQLLIDPIEVKKVAYASLEEIEMMTENKEFWNYRLIDKDYYQTLESVAI